MPRPALTKTVSLAAPAGARADATVAFERALIYFFEEATDLLGVPKSVAGIYAVIFASPTPVSFAEIEARLGISKGSVSQGLRMLRKGGAIREVSLSDDPVERFAPELEMRQLIAGFIDSRLSTELDRARERLTALRRQLQDLPAEEARLVKVRVQTLERWQRRSRVMVTTIGRVLQLSR